MSAALQLPMIWEAASPRQTRYEAREIWAQSSEATPKPDAKTSATEPAISLGFYRKHTESMLRRYLYASMQVGRAPNILGDPIARG